jgi:hypothetical protein
MSNKGPRRGFELEKRYNDMQLTTYWPIYNLFECANPGDLDKGKVAILALKAPLNAQEFVEFRKEVKEAAAELEKRGQELSASIESKKSLLNHYKQQNQELQREKGELKKEKREILDNHFGKKNKKGGCTLF